jgi:hypothetical protein
MAISEKHVPRTLAGTNLNRPCPDLTSMDLGKGWVGAGGSRNLPITSWIGLLAGASWDHVLGCLRNESLTISEYSTLQ